MQQFLETEADDKIRIVVDHREDPVFDETFKKFGALVERKVLDVGDFLCSANIVVERKSRSDFEASIIDGRLFTQLPNLVANYPRVVIVVEGLNDDERISRSALLGAYAAIVSDFGASLMFTRDKYGTAELVFHFAKHDQLGKKVPMRIYAKRKTFTPSQTTRSIIESMPAIGPKLAKAILTHFGTVDAVVKASERELAEVPGLGKKKAKILFAIFHYAYNSEEDHGVSQ